MKIHRVFGGMIGAALLTHSFAVKATTQTMIVAGGCFWCVESDFEKVDGVLDVVSGYTGGHTENPTYREVSAKKTGHYEAVKITFDDTKVTLKSLSDYFWKTIDPTDDKGQFCDKGSPYLTAMFYQSDEQKAIYETSLAEIKQSKPFNEKIVTPILAASPFYLAETYHQDYYKKNPIRYRYYRASCGRDSKIEALWGEVGETQSKK
ncbi:peptide-methionine (S)-S-oxide reductase MsrA [Marinomonas algicola]|uniref:peptide-methionine (S)-S-oxide reductase MsrA n=1 Tax=Marinomonas algicola TaxID=2773454 RepID=UPI00174B240B|nr:peptide-methionine (S)-S-oxide reductase MsrA [Marinomonas algicola]